MLPLLWLAFSAPPTALHPPLLPVLPPEVAERLVAPPRCLKARCVNGEWSVDAMAAIPSGQRRVDAETCLAAVAACAFRTNAATGSRHRAATRVSACSTDCRR